jgi:hypothetical protein
MNNFLTVNEVATNLRVRPNWVYLHADELGAYRLGKYLRFSWPRVLECLEKRNRSLGQSPNDPVQGIALSRDKTDREQIGNKTVA